MREETPLPGQVRGQRRETSIKVFARFIPRTSPWDNEAGRRAISFFHKACRSASSRLVLKKPVFLDSLARRLAASGSVRNPRPRRSDDSRSDALRGPISRVPSPPSKAGSPRLRAIIARKKGRRKSNTVTLTRAVSRSLGSAWSETVAMKS